LPQQMRRSSSGGGYLLQKFRKNPSKQAGTDCEQMQLS
jgi:hypothetical protein